MDQEKHRQESEMVEHREEPSSSNSIAMEEESGVPKGYWLSWRFIGSTIAIVLLANNLFLGYSMPANVLNVIDADIGPDPNIYLATLINTLIKGVGLLLVGSISDVLGRRYFIVGGQAFGLIGACIAATAKNVNTLIAANLFIGIGGATQVLYPLLIMEIVPNKYRGAAQSAITFSAFPSMGLGPAFARMMVEYTDLRWRWVYWLNAITVGTSLILFLTCYFPPNAEQLGHRASKVEQAKQIDFVGFFLYAGGLISLLLALGWGGRQYAWDSAPVIATLVIGVVVLVVFTLYEIYMPLKAPLIPMNLFKIRNFVVCVIVGSIGQMSFYALNVIWPQHITNLYTTDNVTVGWMSCTTGAALAAGEVISGPFCKKGMRIKLQMYLSVIGLCLFCGLMALGNQNRQSLALAMTIVIGLFVGWIELICIVVATLVIPPEHIGSGTAFFASFRAVTGTIATSIYVAIQTNEYAAYMPSRVTAAASAAGLPKSDISTLITAISSGVADAIDSVPNMTSAIKEAVAEAMKVAYAKSYATVYLSSLSFGGVALITCFFATHDLENYFTNYLNKTVDAPHLEAKKGDAENLKAEVKTVEG